jgi:hypothetical protein
MIYYEDEYLRALAKFSDLKRKTWLLRYFELYKSTLIWPDGFPPIKSCNLISGTLKEKFYSVYHESLLDFDYEFDNEKRTLEIL